MRNCNGYRGVHEFVSRTRVVQLPDPLTRPTLAKVCFTPPTCEPDGLPERVGTFVIREAWRWGENERTLVGQDPSLGRTGLIWQRSATEPPLAPKRRDLARPARMRWVASVLDATCQWDAFSSPIVSPLPEAIAPFGPPSWAVAQPVSVQLA